MDPIRFQITDFRYLVPKSKTHGLDQGDQVASQSIYTSLDWFPKRVLVASRTEHDAFRYTVYENAKAAARRIAADWCSEAVKYAMIEAKRPIKAFFDFDHLPHFHSSVEEFHRASFRAVVLFCGFVAGLLGCNLSTCLRGWKFYSACSSRKNSIHAHGEMTFKDIAELKKIMLRFRDYLRALHEHLPATVRGIFTGGGDIIDFTIYTERPFRLPFNRKSVQTTNYLFPMDTPCHYMWQDILVGFVHDNLTTVLPTLEQVSTIYKKHFDMIVHRNVVPQNQRIEAAEAAAFLELRGTKIEGNSGLGVDTLIDVCLREICACDDFFINKFRGQYSLGELLFFASAYLSIHSYWPSTIDQLREARPTATIDCAGETEWMYTFLSNVGKTVERVASFVRFSDLVLADGDPFD